MNLAGQTVSALGGQKYLDGGNNAFNSFKESALRYSQQTIPTAEKIISQAGLQTMKGINKASPAIGTTLKNGANFFKNKSNPYNGQAIPGSSPFMRSIAGSSSFTIRTGSIGQKSAVQSLGGINSIPSAPKVNSPKEQGISNINNALSFSTKDVVMPVSSVQTNPFNETNSDPVATTLLTDFRSLPKLRPVNKVNPAAYSGIMNVSNFDQISKKYTISERTMIPLSTDTPKRKN
jgi:hypothetical protein